MLGCAYARTMPVLQILLRYLRSTKPDVNFYLGQVVEYSDMLHKVESVEKCLEFFLALLNKPSQNRVVFIEK